MHFEFEIEAGDFSNAGYASSQIKKILKQLNLPNNVVKKAVVALFEAEVNVIGHSFGGTVAIDIENEQLHILVSDTGPGIEDVDLAMSEGYSTATKEIQEMGFGAGMGLPNIKKNTDYLNIRSQAGDHTEIEMLIHFDQNTEESSDQDPDQQSTEGRQS
ncbi:MAG: ATP-binding protein [Spirochaetia bacterium]